MSNQPYALLLEASYKFPRQSVEKIMTMLTEEDILTISDAIAALHKKASGNRMQIVIQKYFGIGYECLTLEKIGRQLEKPVSIERVRILKFKAMHSIRLMPIMRPVIEKLCASNIDGVKLDSWYVEMTLSLPTPVQMEALLALTNQTLAANESTTDWHSLPIYSQNFSQRTLNVLRNDDIVTLGQLCNMTVSELLRKPNFGRKSLIEIEAYLASIGKKLLD